MAGTSPQSSHEPPRKATLSDRNISGKKGERKGGKNVLKKPLGEQRWLKNSSRCPKHTPRERR